MTEAFHLVAWLRAAGEPTRLRLLALCAERELSVSELALAVGQSGPRVSRHLKILCAAGLLSRLRCGQWVHYRLSQDPAAARFLRSLVADLDPADPLLAPDRGRVRIAAAEAPDEPGGDLRLNQALASFITSSAGAERRGSTLIVGVQHPGILASLLHGSSDCTAIAHSRRAAQAASAFVKHEALACRIVFTESSDEPIGPALLRSGVHYEAVVLNRLTPHPAALSVWLLAARQVLEPTGRLWLFERYAPPSAQRANAAPTQPLARLRASLDEAGFACERLSPIHGGREPVLAAVAVPAWAVRATSVA